MWNKKCQPITISFIRFFHYFFLKFPVLLLFVLTTLLSSVILFCAESTSCQLLHDNFCQPSLCSSQQLFGQLVLFCCLLSLYSFCLCSSHPVPTPPTFFTKVVNSSSVQVLWELPSKAGKAEGFRLSYRRVPHAVFQGPIQLPCHINAHTLTKLGEWVFLCMWVCVYVCACVLCSVVCDGFFFVYKYVLSSLWLFMVSVIAAPENWPNTSAPTNMNQSEICSRSAGGMEKTQIDYTINISTLCQEDVLHSKISCLKSMFFHIVARCLLP